MLEGRHSSHSSHCHVLPIPCRSVPSLQLVPQAVPLLGHGDGVFILFCLNELVCVRLGNGGRGVSETSTWGMYPWRSECQDTFGWLKTIKVQRAALCQLCSSVSSANIPCVLCWALHSLADRFCCIQAQIFSPSLAATTGVQACPGSSSRALIATQAGKQLYLSCASVQLMTAHRHRAVVEAQSPAWV